MSIFIIATLTVSKCHYRDLAALLEIYELIGFDYRCHHFDLSYFSIISFSLHHQDDYHDKTIFHQM